ncbi:unnamed protein product [Triticum turgidum subsp. durum]|uniref:Uncharacterized protein n=1 Tax=Triticum turgidum subsp. durum TaxID=4567 RepID=A0A9R1BVD1_TRITD|nr:unnamed protein product [Triticum turgidum subsp. durum]
MVTGICDLPADCLALVASLTSPGDACRLAATAIALRAAADSDQVWGSFLPADCTDILARCSAAGDERRREGETNKELFSRLCDCPVFLDGGKLCLFDFLLPTCVANSTKHIIYKRNTPQHSSTDPLWVLGISVQLRSREIPRGGGSLIDVVGDVDVIMNTKNLSASIEAM